MLPTCRLLALLQALATLTVAQTPPCDAWNDTSTLTTGVTTPWCIPSACEWRHAWRYVPTASLTVLAGRVCTGNTALAGDLFMKLEIWDEVAGAPGTPLASGTWKVDSTLGIAWVGANFDAAVSMAAGTPYWIVWIGPDVSELPEGYGLLVTNHMESSVVPWLTPPFATPWTVTTPSAPKFRLYCSLLDDLNVTTAGNSCLGSTSRQGTAHTNHQPVVGNLRFQVEGTGFPSSTLALLVAGFVPGFATTMYPGMPPGCTQSTDIVMVLVGYTGIGFVVGPTAAGHVTFPMPIPNAPVLAGGYVGVQIAAYDPGMAAALPFTSSNALRIVVY